MRYTRDDYDHATALILGSATQRAALAPSERRLLDRARAAYLIGADVPLSEVKITRAIFTAAGISDPAPGLATG